MIKKVFIFGVIILSVSMIGASFISAEKNTPEEAVRKYWQYLLEGNCQKMNEISTNFTGYRRDEKGQIYQVSSETHVSGEKADNASPSCFLAEHVATFVSKKYFKVIKSEVDDELRVASVLISTKDHNKIERKFEFNLSKDPKDEIWKITGFNMLVDEDK